MYTNIFALNFACFITWSSLVITMIPCVESKNPFMETLPEFSPQKKGPLCWKKTTTSWMVHQPILQIPGPDRCQFQLPNLAPLQSLPLTANCQDHLDRPTLWREFFLGPETLWRERQGQHLGAGFRCRFFFYSGYWIFMLIQKRLVVKQPDTLQVRLCVLVAKTVQSLVMFMVEVFHWLPFYWIGWPLATWSPAQDLWEPWEPWYLPWWIPCTLDLSHLSLSCSMWLCQPHLGRVGWKIMENQEASLLGHGSSLHYHLHCRSRIPLDVEVEWISMIFDHYVDREWWFVEISRAVRNGVPEWIWLERLYPESNHNNQPSNPTNSEGVDWLLVTVTKALKQQIKTDILRNLRNRSRSQTRMVKLIEKTAQDSAREVINSGIPTNSVILYLRNRENHVNFREAVFTHGFETLAGVLFTDVVLEYFSENVPVLHLRRGAWRKSTGAEVSRSTSNTCNHVVSR